MNCLTKLLNSDDTDASPSTGRYKNWISNVSGFMYIKFLLRII